MCYDFQQGIIDDEKDMMFITQPKLLFIGTIILFKESIVMFNIDAICKLTIDLKKL
jgi:hypothetical protein